MTAVDHIAPVTQHIQETEVRCERLHLRQSFQRNGGEENAGHTRLIQNQEGGER